MPDPLPKDLLDILVCPETHQPLRVAEPAILDRLHARQAEGKLLNRAGATVSDVFQAALVRQDGRFAYLIVDQIPIMLIDEAIPLGD